MLLDDALPGGGSAERPAPHKAKTAPTLNWPPKVGLV